jgi:hypothetical protein
MRMIILYTIIIILFVTSIYLIVDNSVSNRIVTDYNIEHVEIDGMDCIMVWEYSQLGITCDWRSGKVLDNQ